MSTSPPVANAGAPLGFGVLLALIVALQFGPMVGLLGFRVTGSTAWSLVGGVRDALVLLLALIAGGAWLATPTRTQLPASARWAIGLAITYTGFALFATQHPVLVGLNLRRLALVPILFAALLVVPWSREQLQRLVAWVLGTSAVVAVWGLIERFAPDALWTSVFDVVGFFSANPLDPWGALPFEYSGRFFSWDLEPITGTAVRRLVATYLEPTTLAPTMAMAMLLALAARARRRFDSDAMGAPAWARRTALPWLAFMVAGVLTVSKGFALFLGMLVLLRVFGLPQPRQVFLLALLSVGAAVALSDADWAHGAFAHAVGLASAVDYLLEGNLLGEGIGAAGNYSAIDTDVGAESGLGNGIAQVGLAALLPLLWVRAIALDVRCSARARRDPGGEWLGAWLLLWFLTYLLSASSLGVGGNAIGFTMLALYLHPAWHARAV